MRNFENKEKIVQVSGALRIVSLLLMLLFGFGTIAGLEILISKLVGLSSYFSSRHIGFLILGYGMEFMIWWNFWSFFSRLKAGHLFDALTVKRLAIAGRWKIAVWFYSMIAIWARNQLAMHPSAELLDGLFVGVGIIFTAWLLREGQTLEEEQKLTV